MVKQVTGPSAVQVAVLKTSLQKKNGTHVKPGNTDLSMPLRGEERYKQKAEIVWFLSRSEW